MTRNVGGIPNRGIDALLNGLSRATASKRKPKAVAAKAVSPLVLAPMKKTKSAHAALKAATNKLSKLEASVKSPAQMGTRSEWTKTQDSLAKRYDSFLSAKSKVGQEKNRLNNINLKDVKGSMLRADLRQTYEKLNNLEKKIDGHIEAVLTDLERKGYWPPRKE